MTCLFCQIASNATPATIVYQDDLVTAFQDIHPVAPVHLLVIPNQHVESLADLDTADPALAARLLRVCQQVARDAGLAERGYRVTTNIGRGAGQSVMHLHFHVIGGRPFSWPPG